jgi:hypothetical protein
MIRGRATVMLALGLLGSLPLVVEAAAPLLKITSCEEDGGTYRVTIRVHPEESAHLDTQDPLHGFVCHGTAYAPGSYVLSGLPSGATVAWWASVDGLDYSGLVNPAGAPSCGAATSSEGDSPLFRMWLLTGGGKYCILISETHPSIERQQAACFPGEGWSASDAPCAGGVYADDTWGCDALGYERAPLSRLLEIYRGTPMR